MLKLTARLITILSLSAALSACAGGVRSGIEWDKINYAELTCADCGGHSEDSVASIGRGKR